MKHLMVLLLAALFAPLAWPHKASDAYLLVSKESPSQVIQVQDAIALRDLDLMLDTLDANQDRAISYGEIKAAIAPTIALLGEKILWRCQSQEQAIQWQYQGLDARSEGVFLQLSASLAPLCSLQNMQLQYQMMQGLDADHRLALSIQSSEHTSLVLLGVSELWQPLIAPTSSRWENLKSFIGLGTMHILQGADHMAFVICLMLGLSLLTQWRQMLIIITAFTLGHSATLIAASLGQAAAPAWIEPVIALSITATAAANLAPSRLTWLHHPRLREACALVFGAIHGWGFSGGLAEAHVSEQVLPWALAGFNLGVEIGQLMVIAAWSVIYAWAFEWKYYQAVFVKTGSLLLIGFSLYWAFQRIAFI